MIDTAKIGLILGVIGCTFAAGVIGAGLFVESGFYDIGADAPSCAGRSA
jgi:hypothetical protein